MRLEEVIVLEVEGENGDRRIVTGKIGAEPFGTLTLPLEQGAKSALTLDSF
jgi:hypothetical protein